MKQLSNWSFAVAAATLMAGVALETQAAGKNTVKLGYGYTDFSNDSGELYDNVDFIIPTTPAGITAAAKNVDAVIFTYNHNFNENWGLEIGLGIPPTVKLESQLDPTSPGGAVEVGEATSLAPSFLAIYTLPLQNGFSVYGGLGFNYTKFQDAEAYDVYTLATSTLIAGGDANALAGMAAGTIYTDADIDDSVGLAVKLGASYDINEHFLVDISYSYYDVTADITNTTVVTGAPSPLESIARHISIDVDPSVYTLSVGYRF